MNIYSLYLTILLLIASTFSGCSPSTLIIKDAARFRDIRTILVVPFKSLKSEWGQNIALSIAASLPRSHFRVLNQLETETLLDSLGFTITQLTDNTDLLIGKIPQIDAVVSGILIVDHTRVSSGPGITGLMYGREVDFISRCNLYMFDPQTGKPILTFEYDDFFNPEGRAMESDLTIGQLFATEVSKQLRKR